MGFILTFLAATFVFGCIAYLFTGSKILSAVIAVAVFCSLYGIRLKLTAKAADISDGNISYEIKFVPYSKKKTVRIKKYVSDEKTNTAKLVFNEKCSFEDGSVGQVAEKDEFSKYKTYRPCFFEYKISSKNDQLNGKTLRIGLLDKKGVPLRAERIKDKSSWSNGTVDEVEQIIDSKNYYVQFR